MKKNRFTKILSWVLIAGGAVGLFASAMILTEEISTLKNPSYQPICNLSPFISCGSVMASDQAHIFGFTNAMIGLMAFPVVITTGVILLQKIKLQRWYWLGLQGGSLLGLIFVHWLFFQTTYNLNRLCVYCISLWIVTITIFWYTTLHNLNSGNIKAPAKLAGLNQFAQKHHLDILIGWFFVLFVLDMQHFWYYFFG